jgi:hypothetical protein
MSNHKQAINPNFEAASRRPSITDTPAVKYASICAAFGAIIIAALTFLIYSNTFNSPFVLDDLSAITKNYHIRISTITLDSILNSVQEKASRPIPIISFAINYYFGQYNPSGYHFINILIHALNGILLFLFFKATLNISNRVQIQYKPAFSLPVPIIALMAAGLWAVHPVNTQSVTYIVQRMNSMAAFFSLLVFLFYIQSRVASSPKKRYAWWCLTAFAWLLAIGSKETAAIIPFAVLLYEWYFFQDLNKRWLKSSLKYFIAVGLVFGIIAFIHLGFDPIAKLNSLRDFSEARFTLHERVLTQFRVVVYYLSLFIFPHPSRLNLDYDFPLSHSLFDPVTTCVAALFLVGILITAALTARRYRIYSFCILWYFLNLAIESSIIPLAIIFEHRTYVPFMGPALLIILLADRYIRIISLKVSLIILLVCTFSVWTYHRNEIWKDSETLWKDVVRKSPAKARPYTNLGNAFYNTGSFQEAIKFYEMALKNEPYHK